MLRVSQLLALFLAILVLGCSQGGVETKVYQVKMPTGEEKAKQILERYVAGEPLSSEVTSFPGIVEEVRKSDPQKADLLEKGFAEIQKSPASRAAKAKDLLSKL